jgi:fructokinase
MPDVIALGEMLIDFVATQSGVDLADAPGFVKAPGGAPANVAVGLARLGVSSAFMGQVGDDAFGRFLAQTLKENDVDVSALHFSTAARTALAFVSLSAEGERDFMFYRHPSADMLYTPQQVDGDAALIRSAKIFHFGSISLIDEPARSATLRAIEIAREAGLLISYDPNLRMPLWPSADAAREGMRLGWAHADVVKASEEELVFVSGKDDLLTGSCKVWQPQMRLLVITRGAKGCAYFTPEFSGEAPGFEVNVVDTTGAGDGFVAGLLQRLLAETGAFADEPRLRRACRFANAVGALTTTERGAIPALPDMQRVQSFVESRDGV